MKQERYHAAAVGRSKAGSLGHPTTPIHIHCIARLVGDDDDDYQDGDNGNPLYCLPQLNYHNQGRQF